VPTESQQNCKNQDLGPHRFGYLDPDPGPFEINAVSGSGFILIAVLRSTVKGGTVSRSKYGILILRIADPQPR